MEFSGKGSAYLWLGGDQGIQNCDLGGWGLGLRGLGFRGLGFRVEGLGVSP